MPRWKKPGTGRDWKPGQSGNPAGSKPIPKELKEAWKLNALALTNTVNKIGRMTKDELQAFIKSGEASVTELAIVGQFQAAIKGRTIPLSWMCDRIIGPIKQQIQVDATLGGELNSMSEDEKDRFLENLNATLATEDKADPK